MIQELFSKHKSKVNFISTAQSTTSALEGFKIFTTYITDSCTGYTPEAHWDECDYFSFRLFQNILSSLLGQRHHIYSEAMINMLAKCKKSVKTMNEQSW